MQHGIDQRAIRVSRSRVHDETRGLVHHEQVVVSMKHLYRNILRLKRGHRRTRAGYIDPLSSRQTEARPSTSTIHLDLT